MKFLLVILSVFLSISAMADVEGFYCPAVGSASYLNNTQLGKDGYSLQSIKSKITGGLSVVEGLTNAMILSMDVKSQTYDSVRKIKSYKLVQNESDLDSGRSRNSTV